ncbi:MAG: heme-binding protein, partial [Gammaproteobacteria bacterium]
MSIRLEQAKALVDASLVEARKLNLKPISVIVLDDRGALVAAASEDGVSAMRAKIAHGKANAAIALGLGTRALMNRAEQQAYFIQAMNGLAGGDFVPVPGGLLLRDASG